MSTLTLIILFSTIIGCTVSQAPILKTKDDNRTVKNGPTQILPIIKSIDPTIGPIGTEITISGEFLNMGVNRTIMIGSATPCIEVSNTGTQLICTVGEPVKCSDEPSGNITLSAEGLGAITSYKFTVEKTQGPPLSSRIFVGMGLGVMGMACLVMCVAYWVKTHRTVSAEKRPLQNTLSSDSTTAGHNNPTTDLIKGGFERESCHKYHWNSKMIHLFLQHNQKTGMDSLPSTTGPDVNNNSGSCDAPVTSHTDIIKHFGTVHFKESEVTVSKIELKKAGSSDKIGQHEN